MQNKKAEKIFVLALSVSILLLYSLSLNTPFMLDDQHMIVENIIIKNVFQLPWLFKGLVTSAPIPKGMCRPLLMLTFAFNYITSGINPAGYRILNILLHFINTMLLYALLKRLGFKKTPFLLAGMITLFAIHPINSEAIIYISSRSDLLVTFFLLVGFLLYLSKKTALFFLSYAGALLTKETALCLPLLIFAHIFINRENLLPQFRKNKQQLIICIGAVMITVFYLIYKSTVFAPDFVAPFRGIYSNILVQLAVTLLYFKLFIFPYGLNIVHNIPDFKSPFAPAVAAGCALIVLLITIMLIKRRKNPQLSLGIAWLLICLLPKFYARLQFPAMEHHFYSAGIGAYIILAAAGGNIYQKYKKVFQYGLSGIIVLFFVLGLFRNYEYAHPLIFWKTACRSNPHSRTIHNNLGLEYSKLGLREAAKKEFEKAIKESSTQKDTIKARINLANILTEEKKYAAAAGLLEETLKLTEIPPAGIHNTLGIIYAKERNGLKALENWHKELYYYPNSVETYLNLGTFYMDENNPGNAENMFKNAILANPDHYAGYLGLARIAKERGNDKESEALYKKGISLHDAASRRGR